MEEIALTNALIAKEHGIDIDTLCLTKQGHVVKVRNFNTSCKGVGYCRAAKPWAGAGLVNENFTNILCNLKNGTIGNDAFVSNYHKISALTPIKKIVQEQNLSYAEFVHKYGEEVEAEFIYLSRFVKSFKKENKEPENEKMKKIKEASKILYEILSDRDNKAIDLFQ